jgi:AraC-like DNA-binding protein
VTVMPTTCQMPRSGPGVSYHVNKTWVGFCLSGVFTLHARREDHLIHPGLGVVFPQGIDYQMSHPTNDGDTALALGFAPGIVDEALPQPIERLSVARLDLRVRHQVGVLMAASDRRDELLVEQLALELLGAVAAHMTPSPASTASRSARAKVDRVRLLLAEQPEERWTLETLGELVGYSSYHLARQFRAHTGTSVHRYVADLRAAAALQRIEAGETSLATLATDLGFSHHSHLTATLRRRIGLTPRMIREHLRQRSVERAG